MQRVTFMHGWSLCRTGNDLKPRIGLGRYDQAIRCTHSVRDHPLQSSTLFCCFFCGSGTHISTSTSSELVCVTNFRFRRELDRLSWSLAVQCAQAFIWSTESSSQRCLGDRSIWLEDSWLKIFLINRFVLPLNNNGQLELSRSPIFWDRTINSVAFKIIMGSWSCLVHQYFEIKQ
jgi:hypothetical protein